MCAANALLSISFLTALLSSSKSTNLELTEFTFTRCDFLAMAAASMRPTALRRCTAAIAAQALDAVIVLIERNAAPRQVARVAPRRAAKVARVAPRLAAAPLVADEPLTKEVCKACGRGDDAEHILLCDRCDAEYHQHCLDPPLAEVPACDWFCPTCVQDIKATRASRVPRVSVSQALVAKHDGESFNVGDSIELRGDDNGLPWIGRIAGWSKDSSTRPRVVVNWYYRAQDIPPHQMRRLESDHGTTVRPGELFATSHSDKNEIASIVRKCVVSDNEDEEVRGRRPCPTRPLASHLRRTRARAAAVCTAPAATRSSARCPLPPRGQG